MFVCSRCPTVYCMHRHTLHISKHVDICMHAQVQLALFALVFGDSCLPAVRRTAQLPILINVIFSFCAELSSQRNNSSAKQTEPLHNSSCERMQ